MLKNQVELQKLQNAQQSDLLKAVFEAQESERKRLAEDLHDSVGQVLSVIKFNLHRLENICSNKKETRVLTADTRNLAEECILEIRNIIHNMMPHLLINFGLSEAVKELCLKVEQRSGIQVNFMGKTDERFPPEIEVTLYRIIQELFSNAIRHSGASKIELSLTKEPDLLLMHFRDNGEGFDLEKIKQEGFGLKNIQSRAQLINGSVEIDGGLQKGAEIMVKISYSP